ncbi:nucleotidyltransferase [Actinomadura logoneensis]|uniref:Nucleotidyltransferase n=1 Tax=Actinomadura logoneensis TaxID=2293572 RepID=A0A372JMY2_9ACTN|nr:nucleotidyltransferase domain-containing protein [Actinomadura logoneensis]RFU41372.1 nucleotidyltransferase [Actinomadura logoneensis]
MTGEQGSAAGTSAEAPAGASSAPGHRLVTDHTVLSVVVGSRAYGLDTAASDTDRRGVFVAPTELYWHFDKPPTHVTGPGEEQFSWEFERFCELALAANPTVLECLWSPLVEHVTPIGAELLDVRTAFVSKRAHRSFLGYAESQFRKMENHQARNPKHVMHMLRLLISGLHLLEHGEPLVRMDDHRDRLLAVRAGEVPLDEVGAWRASLTARMADALARTSLPDEPDRPRVDALLHSVRRRTLPGA